MLKYAVKINNLNYKAVSGSGSKYLGGVQVDFVQGIHLPGIGFYMPMQNMVSKLDI